MIKDIYNRYPFFIKEYIYKQGWTELKEIQKEASHIIFNTKKHLLIGATTASGKTEAAFFPVLTDIYGKKSNSIQVLYIGPLKALINDQFSRISDLLKKANIPIWKWHGDVAINKKKKLLENPSGILQITPESLESLFMNHSEEISKLFCDLKYIIIDEVHVFMGQSRGLHLLCSINKIEKCIHKQPKRIGLSATLGDYANSEKWLTIGSDIECSIVTDSTTKRNIRLAVEHFSEEHEQIRNDFYDFLYQSTYKKNSIIFTNTRGEAEDCIQKLKRISENDNNKNSYYAHHGSLSRVLRLEAEERLKNTNVPTVVAATLTLELGIDISNLDRVVQIGAPYTCSSFVQRLGRSGRKTKISEMWFACPEYKGDESISNKIPWDLLRIIAIIQLYIEERWVEPIKIQQYPYSLLYHQTLSVLSSFGAMKPKKLAEFVLNIPIFKNVSQEEYKIMLKYLVGIEHIQKTFEGELLVGLKGEDIIKDYKFYSVIPDELEYTVLDDNKKIGTVNFLPSLNSAFIMGGTMWVAIEINLNQKKIYAKRGKGVPKRLWEGKGGDIHDKVLSKMKQVLNSEDMYPYLQNNAKMRLITARRLVNNLGLLDTILFPVGKNRFYFIPWVGSKLLKTIYIILQNKVIIEGLNITKIELVNKYSIMFYSNVDIFTFEKKFMNYILQIEDLGIDLVNSNLVVREDLEVEKFDQYIPESLLKKSYAKDCLDIKGAKRWAEKTIDTYSVNY